MFHTKQYEQHPPARVPLAGIQAEARRAGEGVVIVVPALAHGEQRGERDIAALDGGAVHHMVRAALLFYSRLTSSATRPTKPRCRPCWPRPACRLGCGPSRWHPRWPRPVRRKRSGPSPQVCSAHRAMWSMARSSGARTGLPGTAPARRIARWPHAGAWPNQLTRPGTSRCPLRRTCAHARKPSAGGRSSRAARHVSRQASGRSAPSG
jgi:hypothetical protein